MTTTQTAFENHVFGKADLRKNPLGRYIGKRTRAAFNEFKVIYEMGQASVLSAVRARKPMGEALRQVGWPGKVDGYGIRRLEEYHEQHDPGRTCRAHEYILGRKRDCDPDRQEV